MTSRVNLEPRSIAATAEAVMLWSAPASSPDDWAEIQMKREDLALRAQIEALKDDRERDKTALEFALRAAELNVDWEKLEIDKARKATSA